MTTFDRSKTLPLGAITAHRLGRGLASISARFDRWLAIRRTLAEIGHLDQRQLDDIGLTPADLARFKRNGQL